MKICIIVVLIFCFRAPQNLLACTAFCLKNDSVVIVAKNLDWAIGDGFIVVNEKGVPKFSLVNPGEKSVHWISKYGSVTFNQFGVEFPLGGMNEAGLVVEELSYSPAVYPKNDSLCSLNELQWIQYQLDSFGSVQEVIDHLSEVRISKFLFGLHYFLSDRSGKSAVIEFINGRTVCYSGNDLPIAVLSNNSYQNSINYLKFHQGFGGEKIPRDGSGSQERFVRAAALVQNYNDSSPIKYAFSILENVKQHDTQWSIIYDPVHFSVIFKINRSPYQQRLDFCTVDFSDDKRAAFYELGIDCSFGALNQCFSIITQEANSTLIGNVINKLVDFEELDQLIALKIMDRLSNYHLKMMNN